MWPLKLMDTMHAHSVLHFWETPLCPLGEQDHLNTIQALKAPLIFWSSACGGQAKLTLRYLLTWSLSFFLMSLYIQCLIYYLILTWIFNDTVIVVGTHAGISMLTPQLQTRLGSSGVTLDLDWQVSKLQIITGWEKNSIAQYTIQWHTAHGTCYI